MTAQPRTAREHGETLLESLVSMLLMGTLLLAILTTLFSVVRATDVNRRLVRSGIGVVEVAETIELADYHPCSTGDEAETLALYQDQIDFDVPGYHATIVDVRFAGTSSGTVAFAATCAGTDTGMQQLTVRLSTTGGQPVTQRLTFYKRTTSCPNGYTGLFAGQPC